VKFGTVLYLFLRFSQFKQTKVKISTVARKDAANGHVFVSQRILAWFILWNVVVDDGSRVRNMAIPFAARNLRGVAVK
jgi:hypothetical protein